MALGVFVLGLDGRGQSGDRLGMFELRADLDLELERRFHHVAERLALRPLRRQRGDREADAQQHQPVVFPPGEAPDLAEHHDALRLGEQDEGENEDTLEGEAGDKVGGGLAPGRKQQQSDRRQAHRGRVRPDAKG